MFSFFPPKPKHSFVLRHGPFLEHWSRVDVGGTGFPPWNIEPWSTIGERGTVISWTLRERVDVGGTGFPSWNIEPHQYDGPGRTRPPCGAARSGRGGAAGQGAAGLRQRGVVIAIPLEKHEK